MLSSPTLTRPQFEQACKAFIARYSHPKSSDLVEGRLQGWSWTEHATTSGFGFMSRLVLLSWSRPSTIDPDSGEGESVEVAAPIDEAVSHPQSSVEALTSYQSVVFSPTYQVPAFYFEIHDSKGSPLVLSDILKTNLVHEQSLPETEVTNFGITPLESAYPLLSQGDHPTLGTPSWYIHPCGTPGAMGELTNEIMAEAGPEVVGTTEDDQNLRWLEVWFMVLGNMVDLSI